MEEKALLRAAVTCSLVGMVMLLLVTMKPAAATYAIGAIDDSLIEEKVRLVGMVEEVRAVKGILILNISDNTGSIKSVVFDTEDMSEVEEGMYFDVTGVVDEYHGQIEVKVSRIIVED